MCSNGSDNKGLKCTGCLVRIESKDQQRRGSFFRPRDLMLISIRGIWYQNSNKWLHMFSSAKTLPPLLHSLLTKMATWSYLPFASRLCWVLLSSLPLGWVCLLLSFGFLISQTRFQRNIYPLIYSGRSQVTISDGFVTSNCLSAPFLNQLILSQWCSHSQRGLYRTVTLMMDTEHLNI